MCVVFFETVANVAFRTVALIGSLAACGAFAGLCVMAYEMILNRNRRRAGLALAALLLLVFSSVSAGVSVYTEEERSTAKACP